MLELLVDVCMEESVKTVYKELLAKQLFMTIPSFEELNQRFSNIGSLVKEVIKGIKHDIGMQCSDDEAQELASTAWQQLRIEYEAQQ